MRFNIFINIIKIMSEWIDHVKAYAKKNKVSYKEAMSKAKATYKPKGKKVDKKKMTKKEMEKMEKEKK
tara:strand:- start:5387 stop:5590 length:204 start_codon:yes stop_codon:yes gene_type:complete